MLTKPQFFYDHSTQQALGFQNPCYLKKAQQLKPKLYDGSVIQKTNAIVVHDSEETLMLKDESRSKMLQKQNDPIMSERKVITKPVDYAALNQLSKDFETRFVPQTELSAEQAFWSRYSVQSEEPNLSSSTTIVEVSKELSKVSMVNSSLKKLKFHLASFDVVVKERTTATAITEGTVNSWQWDLHSSGSGNTFHWQWELILPVGTLSWQWECLVHFIPNTNEVIDIAQSGQNRSKTDKTGQKNRKSTRKKKLKANLY
nr:hypothetical protein [Tanacetum cinerariifolium]